MSIVIEGNISIGGNVTIGNTDIDLTRYYITNTTDIQLITEDGLVLID